jgi:trigger factor
LAGKKVVFEVELKEIKEKEVPKLDDAFASGFNGCKTVSDLRAWVQKDLISYEENRVQKNLEAALVKALVHENPITVPPSMVRRQTEFLEKDVEERFRQMGLQGEKLSQALEKIRKDIPERAREEVKAMLLIEAVAEREKIEVPPEEIEREYEQIAKRAKVQAAEIRLHFEKEGKVSGLHWQILHHKVIAWLISKAKLKE